MSTQDPLFSPQLSVQPIAVPIVSASSLAAHANRETILNSLTQDARRIEEILSRMDSYNRSLMEYSCALKELETRLQVLNQEFAHPSEENPIESIETRIKSTHSLVKKMNSRSIPVSVQNMENEISDIAGIRVICSFIQDVYSLANALRCQQDLKILKIKDYIQDPKPNGYRSYHMIVEVPFYLSDRPISKRVEIQFRTIAMDFWASLEHKMRYKKDFSDSAEIHRRLKQCAELSAGLDIEMQELKDKIQAMN